MKRTLKVCLACALISVLLTAGGIAGSFLIERDIHFTPEYGKIDLSPILEKQELSLEDYKTLFYQTGLGPRAIDELRLQENAAEQITQFQTDFFGGFSAECERAGITTWMEYTIDEDGRRAAGFSLAPYHNGYVVAMFSSHSFGWRHGHAGLITGSNRVLEAPILGVPSGQYSLNSWRQYPTFILLRLKDASDEQLEEISKNALKNLTDIDYSPLAGVFKKYSGKQPPNTQCAHLVWYAFYLYGYDIDSTGGNIVTVWDIVNSELFEVIQIYGIDPDLLWRQ